jgi:hypothetical protein
MRQIYIRQLYIDSCSIYLDEEAGVIDIVLRRHVSKDTTVCGHGERLTSPLWRVVRSLLFAREWVLV